MNKISLYSIGHGTRKEEDLLELLKKFNINYLVDVRSKPFSKYNPQFNQPVLKAYLQKNDLAYVFMGNALGGRPDDAICYKLDGRVDYEIVKSKDFFLRGIKRLKTAYEKGISLAIMCSETKPQDCHRSRLIGDFLLSENIILQHIDENGNLRSQTQVQELF